MLKKAGIVVAAAAAGLLAVSPLAFAGDKGDHGHDGHGEGTEVNKTHEDTIEGNKGLINVSDNNTNVPVAVCDNQVPVNVLGVQVPVNNVDVIADLSGALGLGLLGEADAENEDSGDNNLDDSCSAEADIEDNELNSIED